jgi:hypothetical protein
MATDDLGPLFTRAMARQAGYSDGQIRRRIASGHWTVVIGPVLAPRGLAVTPKLRDRAAVMAVPEAVLSGASAARWRGIEIGDPSTWITVPPERHVRLKGVRVRRERLGASDIIRRPDGITVTSLGRTIFDCARSLPIDRAERLVWQAFEKRWVTYDAFLHRVRQNTGMHGIGHLLTLVSRLAQVRQAEPVSILAHLLREVGVAGWRTRQPLDDGDGLGTVELVFDDVRLAIDITGGTRRNSLVMSGWTVLAYSREEIANEGQEVVAEIIATRDQLLSGAGRW